MRDIRYSVTCFVSCVIMLMRFSSCSALRKYSVVNVEKFPNIYVTRQHILETTSLKVRRSVLVQISKNVFIKVKSIIIFDILIY